MTRDEALRKSIVHWEENKKTHFHLAKIFARHCPLCAKYGGTATPCDGCPLAEIGEKCDNPNSLWDQLYNLHNAIPLDTATSIKQWRAACDDMINALKGCLDAPKQ